MPNYYVDNDGWIVDEDGDYVLDENGYTISEDELDDSDEDSEFIQAMTASYHKLESMLGREPTDRELTLLLADAEQTGDPQLADNYERVTNRAPTSESLLDDNTRIEVMAEFAGAAMDEDEDED